MTQRARAVLLGALFASACTFTDRCPEGTAWQAQAGGGYGTDCLPLADSSIDGGRRDAGDSGQVEGDAGPCGACSSDTPLCRASDTMCVQCLGDGDCGDDRCETDSGTCTECLGDADCDADPSEPICMGGNCTACTSDTQCMARNPSLPVCEGGSCVECTADKRDACDTFVCDGSTNTCSETRTENSKGLCQDCIADDECMDGQLCVPMTFGGTDVGSFCLWRQDAPMPPGPGGSCTNVRPYFRNEPASSVDEMAATVCTLRQTTCVALNQFSVEACTAPFASDGDCGVTDLDDGLCRMVDAVTNRCTIPCVTSDDCPGTTCNTGATPRHCNF